MAESTPTDHRVRLSGMWRHTDKNGKPYYSGSLGGGKLLMFPVKEKSENGPDANLYIVPAEPKEKPTAPVADEDF